MRQRLYDTLFSESRAGNAFARVIMLLIVCNVIALMLETVDSVYLQGKVYFAAFEAFSVAVFTIEYALRIWTCTCNPRLAHPLRGRLRYALTPLALVDLFAILPFFIPATSLDLRHLRMLRLLRLMKATRYSKSTRVIAHVFREARDPLIVTLTILLAILIVSSSLLYYAEHDAQPDKFTSIPASLWWGVATLTTVGYGDIYPITPLGKVLSSLISILSIGLFAMPTGILSAGFMESIGRKNDAPGTCPACGQLIPPKQENSL